MRRDVRIYDDRQYSILIALVLLMFRCTETQHFATHPQKAYALEERSRLYGTLPGVRHSSWRLENCLN